MQNLKLVRSRLCLAGVAACLVAAPLGARAASIDVDTYKLLPDATSQQVRVFVGGSDSDNGVSFSILTGEAIPDTDAAVDVRRISNIDLFTETSVFSINDAGYVEVAPISAKKLTTGDFQFAPSTPTMQTAPVTTETSVSSTSSTTTIDPIGIAAFSTGSYSRVLSAVQSPARFRAIAGGGGSIPGAIVSPFDLSAPSGVTPAVPEPATLGLLGLIIPAILLRRRRDQV